MYQEKVHWGYKSWVGQGSYYWLECVDGLDFWVWIIFTVWFWVSFRGRISHNCQSLRRVFIIQGKNWLYIQERNVVCMNLGLFKEFCCFLLFRAISCKMAWSPAYKASFRSFSFELLTFEKLPFFLSESVFPFPYIMSFLSKILFEMISFFLWIGTIFLIALYL